MPKPIASRADTRVTIEKPTIVTDSGGGWETTWSTHAEPWAEIRPANAAVTERLFGDRIEGRISTILSMRWVPGVELEMRVRWSDRYDPSGTAPEHVAAIRGMSNPYGASRELHLAVEEVAP